MQKEDRQMIIIFRSRPITLSAAFGMLGFLSKRRKSRAEEQRPAVIGVGGFVSEVGKTSLMCDLLRSFPEWEAIKITQRNDDSCGKDPKACCLSNMSSHEPLVQSDREKTDLIGNDTGRYWQAGASNVHWVLSTEEQIGEGLRQALTRVKAPGVFIESNSFTEHLRPDFMLMVVPPDGGTIKPSARKALKFTTAIFISDPIGNSARARQRFSSWLKDANVARLIGKLPVFTREDLPEVVAYVWATQLDHSNGKNTHAPAIAS
jgi:hypothetical protein